MFVSLCIAFSRLKYLNNCWMDCSEITEITECRTKMMWKIHLFKSVGLFCYCNDSLNHI